MRYLYCYEKGIKRIYNYINEKYNLDKYYENWVLEEYDILHSENKELAEKIIMKDIFTKDKYIFHNYIRFIYDEITKIYFNNKIDNNKYG